MTDSIVREITLKAPPEKVWRAISDADQFGEWFRIRFDGPFVAGQLSEGSISFDGRDLRAQFWIEAIEPERRFAFRWHPYAVDPAVDYSSEEKTLVEFLLEPAGAGTHLRVTESGFDRIPPARREEALLMNGRGWTIQTERVREYLDG